MSLEAVPCVLKQADGTPVYGLLIRPSCSPRTIILQSPPPPPSIKPPPAPPPVTSSASPLPSADSDAQLASHRVPFVPNHTTGWTEKSHPAPPPRQAHPNAHCNDMGMCRMLSKGHPVESSVAPSSGQVFIPASAVQQYQHNRLPVPDEEAVPGDGTDSQVVPQLPPADIPSSSSLQTSPDIDQHGQMDNDRTRLPLRLPPMQGLSADPSAMELAQLLDDMDTQDLAKILAESESLLAPGEVLDGAIAAEPFPTPHSLTDLSHPMDSSTPIGTSCRNPGPPNSGSLEILRPSCRFQGSERRELFRREPAQENQVPPFIPSPDIIGAPRPQLMWERGPNESSGTPDSGIQSIAGSPTGHELSQQLSPPILPNGEPIRNSRAEKRPLSQNSSPDLSNDSRNENIDSMCTSDFSDMPKLVPEGIQPIDEEVGSSPPSIDQSMECPNDVVSNPPDAPESSVAQPTISAPFSLTSTDPKQLVDGLLSALEPQKLLQFSEYFEAKLKGASAKIAETSPKIPEGSDSYSSLEVDKAVPASPLCPRLAPDDYYSDVSSCSKSENRPSSSASQNVFTDSSEAAKPNGADKKSKMTRLRELRRRIKRIAPPCINSQLDLLIREFGTLVPHQIHSNRAKTYPFTLDWTALLQSRKAKSRSANEPEITHNLGNIEVEADSEDEGDDEMDQGIVRISDNPGEKSISLKIKLSRLKELNPSETIPKTESSLAKAKRPELSLPPKKRIKSVEAALPKPEPCDDLSPNVSVSVKEIQVKTSSGRTEKRKKSRRRAPYPWDRKRKPKSSSADPPVKLSKPKDPGVESPVVTEKPLIRKCNRCRCWVRSSLVPDLGLCSSCSSSVSSSPTSSDEPRVPPTPPLDSFPLIKTYCKAGLFSSDRKVTDEPNVLRLSANIASSSGCFDFRIPFDIWEEFRDRSVTRTRRRKGPAQGFKEIRKNIYLDMPSREGLEPPICRCKVPGSTDSNNTPGCDAECLNRITYVECSLDSCPCGEKCSNRRLQVGGWTKNVQVKDTGSSRGRGLFLSTDVSKGALVGEYVGEVISAERFMRRNQDDYSHFTHHYALNLDAGFVIDSYRRGSILRFSNHSCQPNCEMQKWWVDGMPRMGLFTLRDLQAGEELTYNYNFHSFKAQQVCLCGSENCRGYIGEKVKAMCGKKDPNSSPATITFRPLNFRERDTVRRTRVFLLRTYDRTRSRTLQASSRSTKIQEKHTLSQNLMAQLTALRTSRAKERRKLTAAVENSDHTKIAQLGQVLMKLYRSVAECSLSNGSTFGAQTHNGKKRSSKTELSAISDAILEGKFLTPQQFDSAILALLEASRKTCGKDAIKSVRKSYEKAKREAANELSQDLQFNLSTDFASEKLADDSNMTPDVLAGTADLSYVEEGQEAAGSYDPDKSSENWDPIAEEGDGLDRVRCPCGSVEDEGVMMQCDKCLYWEHQDCVGPSNSEEHVCFFCTKGLKRIPKANVVQVPQPDVRLPSCLYYRCLVTPGGVQVRIGECCYVKKLIGEAHKDALKRFHQNCVEPMQTNEKTESSKPDPESCVTLVDVESESPTYSRIDLRVFRIERLFTSPHGEAFVFGFYYARPHETFCEPTRRFYKSELFCTPLYDTLPLAAVVGRCTVLDPQIYCKGRPIYPRYSEGDVYICEFKVDRSQRFFEKLSNRNRYPINTLPYVFNTFKERLKIKRTFTPFLVDGGTEEKSTGCPSRGDDEATLLNIRKQLLQRKVYAKRENLGSVVQKVFPKINPTEKD